MKKHIITGIVITACVALCAAVWPRSVEGGKVPAEPVKPAVIAEIEAGSEETSQIVLSADTHAPELVAVAKSEPAETEVITTEEKTEATPPIEPASKPATISSSPSSDPEPGTIAVIDGVKCMWIPGFGWVKDEGGGSIAIPVDGEGDINKQVGVMGGGSTVGNPGDEFTGYKVGIMGGDNTPSSEKHNPAPGSKAVINGKPSIWIPGFGWIEDNNAPNVGTVAEDMYENGYKI